MKVLFDHPWPFALAHGGFQIQIEQTKAALERRGVAVEYVRWWDDRQTGDLIHYFGRPGGTYIDHAQAKGFKVVVAELHTALASRSASNRWLQKTLMRSCRVLLPRAFTARLAWEAYQKADAFVALTAWEAHLMQTIFDALPAKIRVVPNGVEDVFFAPSEEPPSANESHYLVCTASIHPRKRILELAEAAVLARTPLRVIGKPYAESEAYYLKFLETAKKHSDLIHYEGAISDRAALAQIYREARGFVLLSTMESLSLSALEAAAARCPLLLSDLPWARTTFGDEAAYTPVTQSTQNLSLALANFFQHRPSRPPTIIPLRWSDVAQQLETLYRSLLAT